jgi:hypothetical protein
MNVHDPWCSAEEGQDRTSPVTLCYKKAPVEEFYLGVGFSTNLVKVARFS